MQLCQGVRHRLSCRGHIQCCASGVSCIASFTLLLVHIRAFTLLLKQKCCQMKHTAGLSSPASSEHNVLLCKQAGFKSNGGWLNMTARCMRPRAVFLTLDMSTTSTTSCDSSGKLKQAIQQKVICGMQQWLPPMQRRQLAVDVTGLDCTRRAAKAAQVRSYMPCL
jgi:hypothetical protein